MRGCGTCGRKVTAKKEYQKTKCFVKNAVYLAKPQAEQKVLNDILPSNSGLFHLANEMKRENLDVQGEKLVRRLCCCGVVAGPQGKASSLERAPLQWRHNGRNGVSNHQLRRCLLNLLFRRRSKKTSTLRVTGLCVGNSPGVSEFPAQMASNAENVFIWWRHHTLSAPQTYSIRTQAPS